MKFHCTVKLADNKKVRISIYDISKVGLVAQPAVYTIHQTVHITLICHCKQRKVNSMNKLLHFGYNNRVN